MRKSQTILTVANYKTLKGRASGYETFGIHFAPANLSGYEVCRNRSKGCTLSCLNGAGMGAFSTTQNARKEKTKRFFEDRDTFLSQLIEHEIPSAIKKAEKKGLTAVFRLNLTSDVEWETIKFKGKTIFEHFPNVRFYDYTKNLDRLSLQIPNYHLTFSRAETKWSQIQAEIALKKGFNVAAVFSTKKDQPLPKNYLDFEVIDGDENDLRFLDKKGVIVGLRAKGPAKQDKTGFVIHV
jgi:hypothetical protein